MRFKKTATTLIAGSLLGVAAYSVTTQPSQVQAKASYRVQITKNAYVYTSKGKKTTTVYKKNKVATAYRIRKIHGKYYYDLGHGKYVRTSYAKKYYYRTYKQSKKITRTIKLYQPIGKKYVYQNTYVKRTVKQNTRTGRKTYGKWGTASWGTYVVPTIKGYTASPKSIASETVYSWTKSKTIKVKYKKISTTPAKQNNANNTSSKTSSTSQSGNSTNSSSSSSNNNSSSSATSDSSTTKPVFNPWDEKKQKMVEQGILQVINDFRKEKGLSSLTLNSDYSDIVNKRAQEKASYGASHLGLVNHDGFLQTIKAMNGRPLSETLTPTVINQYTSDEEQVRAIVSSYKERMQEEKDDYEAIHIKKTKTSATNISGTVGHYASAIDDFDLDGITDTQGATQVAIGSAVDSVNPKNSSISCIAIEYLE